MKTIRLMFFAISSGNETWKPSGRTARHTDDDKKHEENNDEIQLVPGGISLILNKLVDTNLNKSLKSRFQRHPEKLDAQS